jgi:histidinol-phosphate/aromatic aminotransferase/cobyric acid decarboxylase-like protein
MPAAVRITVGTPDKNDRIIDALSDEATGRASS